MRTCLSTWNRSKCPLKAAILIFTFVCISADEHLNVNDHFTLVQIVRGSFTAYCSWRLIVEWTCDFKTIYIVGKTPPSLNQKILQFLENRIKCRPFYKILEIWPFFSKQDHSHRSVFPPESRSISESPIGKKRAEAQWVQIWQILALLWNKFTERATRQMSLTDPIGKISYLLSCALDILLRLTVDPCLKWAHRNLKQVLLLSAEFRLKSWTNIQLSNFPDEPCL